MHLRDRREQWPDGAPTTARDRVVAQFPLRYGTLSGDRSPGFCSARVITDP
jgi:hypothetical protein